jgi:hypothetical protein
LAASFVVHARLLVYPDLVQCYPFLGGDTADWLANGLHWAGMPVRYSVRPPLLPLLMAGLLRLGAMELLPLLLVLTTHITALTGFVALRRRAPTWVAAAVVGALLFNHAGLGESVKIMADTLASCLLCLGAIAFIASLGQPRLYVGAGLLVGASAITQQAAVLFLPAAAAIVLLRRRHHLRSPWLWGGVVAFALPVTAWLVGKLLSYGTIGDLGPAQWDLLRPHLGSIVPYAWAATALLGWPGTALVAGGVVLALVHPDEDSILGMLLAGMVLLFFVLMYDFFDARFLVYALWPAALLMARSLARLPGPMGPVAAALLAVWSIAPTPAFGADPRVLTLTPCPPTYLLVETRAESSGARVVLPGTARVERLTFGQMSGFSHVRQLLVRRRAARPPVPRLWAESAGTHSAILAVRRTSDLASLYHTPTHLGNMLGVKVKVVPLDALTPARGLLELGQARQLGDWVRHKVTIRGLPGSWWLLVQAGPAGEAVIRELSERRPGDLESPAPGVVERASSLLAAAALQYPDGLLAVVPLRDRPEPVLPYLAFLATTSSLRIPDPSELPWARRVLAESGPLETIAVDGALVHRTRIMGTRAVIIVL